MNHETKTLLNQAWSFMDEAEYRLNLSLKNLDGDHYKAVISYMVRLNEIKGSLKQFKD